MDGPDERPDGAAGSRRWVIAWAVAAVALVVTVVASTGRRDGIHAGDAASPAPLPVLVHDVTTVPADAARDDAAAPAGDRRTPAVAGGALGAHGERHPSGTAPHPAVTRAASPPATSGDPAIVARPIPASTAPAPPVVEPPWWAASTHVTGAGYVATDVGCAAGLDPASLDAFFADRLGPMIGSDYQHVIDLHDGRQLWLFQDTFVDPGGSADRLDQAAFVHNAALVQHGACFTLHTRGSATAPRSFEPGTGEQALHHWFWPMGGEERDGRIHQFWVRMVTDGYTPGPGDGLGWHPEGTYLAVYDSATLARLSFGPAPDPGVTPVYGYAVASDDAFTYLFGNTFEQNLVREGGFANGPHSATRMFLARVPLGEYAAAPHYRTAAGDWSADAAAAAPVSERFWVENPMQPRYLHGQWVAATKVDGYWGEELVIDVAREPWGPWTPTTRRGLLPRHGDPLMNTYHAHLLPWLEHGRLVVSISQNARDMQRHAFPHPGRYRPQFVGEALVAPPPPAAPDSSTTTTTTSTTSTTTTTTVPATTSTTSSSTSSSTSTTSTTSSSTSTTPTTSSSSTTTSATTAPAADDPENVDDPADPADDANEDEDDGQRGTGEEPDRVAAAPGARPAQSADATRNA